MGRIVTFYSYKGGVGRTFALANVAVLLAKWGKRVLCVDWDLEAPGLLRYFCRSSRRRPAPSESRSMAASPGGSYSWPVARSIKGGVLELVSSVGDSEPLSWRDLVVTVDGDEGWTVDLLPAGLPGDDYVRRLHELDWSRLYSEHDFGWVLEGIRSEWSAEYDVVLVDSRTGLTDIGGICAAQLPDVLVVMSSANEQGLSGCLDVISRARRARDRLPVARPSPLVLPLASRFDDREEYDEATAWLERFSEAWADEFGVWAPKGTEPRRLLGLLRIPYIGKWSFGESLPSRYERTDDPGLITWSLANVAACITKGLGRIDSLLSNRDAYVRSAAESRDESGSRRLFLSYHHTDEELARRLSRALVERRLSVASVDAMGQVGSVLEHVSGMIERSRAFVFLASRGAMQSRWCQAELELAMLRGVPIINVLMAGARETLGETPSFQVELSSPAHVDGVADEIEAIIRSMG